VGIGLNHHLFEDLLVGRPEEFAVAAQDRRGFSVGIRDAGADLLVDRLGRCIAHHPAAIVATAEEAAAASLVVGPRLSCMP